MASPYLEEPDALGELGVGTHVESLSRSKDITQLYKQYEFNRNLDLREAVNGEDVSDGSKKTQYIVYHTVIVIYLYTFLNGLNYREHGYINCDELLSKDWK